MKETLTLVQEYESLASMLENAPITSELEWEVKRLRELEDSFLLEGQLLASENLLPGKKVAIMQGTGGESSSYFMGEVEEVLSDAKGNPNAIKLKDARVIPFNPNITSVSIIRQT